MTNTKTIFDRVITIMSEKDIDVSEITLETSLKKDMGLDSLDLIDLTMEIEREYNFVISDQEVEKWETLGDVIKYIQNKL